MKKAMDGHRCKNIQLWVSHGVLHIYFIICAWCIYANFPEIREIALILASKVKERQLGCGGVQISVGTDQRRRADELCKWFLRKKNTTFWVQQLLFCTHGRLVYPILASQITIVFFSVVKVSFLNSCKLSHSLQLAGYMNTFNILCQAFSRGPCFHVLPRDMALKRIGCTKNHTGYRNW